MKQFLTYIFAMALGCSLSTAKESKELSLDFNMADFPMTSNSFGEILLHPKQLGYTYKDKAELPCIPYKYISIAIPYDCDVTGIEWTQNQEVIKENVRLACSPMPIPTNADISDYKEKHCEITEGIYPAKRVEVTGSYVVSKWKIVNVKLSPFEYDAAKGELSFANNITLNMRYAKSSEPKGFKKISAHNIPMLRNSVINPEDIIVPEGDSADSPLFTVAPSQRIDYLIVTCDSLKDAFMPLVEWKTMKGVRADIITIDSIAARYQGPTMQLKIKRCLEDYHYQHDLHYALLGGDDSIVPVMGCYAFVKDSYELTDMPTDLYYSCFGDSFDWDGNGNGIYGEMSDNIILTQSIYVTRAPVRTVEHASTFVNKVLYYEKTPTLNGWNNRALMCGCKLHWYCNTSEGRFSDASLYGEWLSEYFNWDGHCVNFYDTNTDFPLGADYDVTASHFLQELSNGYSIIDINTHGYVGSLSMEIGDFTNLEAQYSVSTQPAIILTCACFPIILIIHLNPVLVKS